jgi:hypothetical protein
MPVPTIIHAVKKDKSFTGLLCSHPLRPGRLGPAWHRPLVRPPPQDGRDHIETKGGCKGCPDSSLDEQEVWVEACCWAVQHDVVLPEDARLLHFPHGFTMYRRVLPGRTKAQLPVFLFLKESHVGG